jgi:hypothetical protein
MDHSNVTKILDLAALTGTITNLYFILTAKELGFESKIR